MQFRKSRQGNRPRTAKRAPQSRAGSLPAAPACRSHPAGSFSPSMPKNTPWVPGSRRRRRAATVHSRPRASPSAPRARWRRPRAWKTARRPCAARTACLRRPEESSAPARPTSLPGSRRFQAAQQFALRQHAAKRNGSPRRARARDPAPRPTRPARSRPEAQLPFDSSRHCVNSLPNRLFRAVADAS